MKVLDSVQMEWEYAILLEAKKDVSIRFCVDYRTLNAVNILNSYPIARMEV